MIFFSARHGKNLSAMDIVRGLKACYGLSTSCAMFLSFGGYILLRKFRRVSLYEIGKHNAVEHNASLVHHDILEGQIFAPIEIDHSLVDALVSDVKPSLAEIEKSPDPTAEFLKMLRGLVFAEKRNAIRLITCMLKSHEEKWLSY